MQAKAWARLELSNAARQARYEGTAGRCQMARHLETQRARLAGGSRPAVSGGAPERSGKRAGERASERACRRVCALPPTPCPLALCRAATGAGAHADVAHALVFLNTALTSERDQSTPHRSAQRGAEPWPPNRRAAVRPHPFKLSPAPQPTMSADPMIGQDEGTQAMVAEAQQNFPHKPLDGVRQRPERCRLHPRHRRCVAALGTRARPEAGARRTPQRTAHSLTDLAAAAARWHEQRLCRTRQTWALGARLPRARVSCAVRHHQSWRHACRTAAASQLRALLAGGSGVVESVKEAAAVRCAAVLDAAAVQHGAAAAAAACLPPHRSVPWTASSKRCLPHET